VVEEIAGPQCRTAAAAHRGQPPIHTAGIQQGMKTCTSLPSAMVSTLICAASLLITDQPPGDEPAELGEFAADRG
jgi:hypothetical protein